MAYKFNKGFTLTEILVALSVLAFAMVPLMGVMWSGVRRTDISDSYANATTIAASICEYLLSDTVKFDHLDFTNPQAAGGLRDAGNSMESAGINVDKLPQEIWETYLPKNEKSPDKNSINKFLGRYCGQTNPPDECGVAVSKNRYFKRGRQNYYTDLYVGAYYENVPKAAGVSATQATSLSYQYMMNPPIDYEKVPTVPHQFYDTLSLSGASYLTTGTGAGGIPQAQAGGTFNEYSPYHHSTWSLDPTAHSLDRKTDDKISFPMASPNIPYSFLGSPDDAKYANFCKIQVFVRWGMEWVSNDDTVNTAGPGTGKTDIAVNTVDSRGKAKMIQLITFKGRFN